MGHKSDIPSQAVGECLFFGGTLSDKGRQVRNRESGAGREPTQYHRYIAEVVPGLSEFAVQELRSQAAPAIKIDRIAEQEVEFTCARVVPPGKLKTIQALYSLERFMIPRPKALLGDQHLRILLRQLLEVVRSHNPGIIRTMHLAAAGADSSVMMRLKQTLRSSLGLQIDDEAGDLLLRIRRTPDEAGWETLARLTPRPLATREWRICDVPGALNATVAYVMSLLAAPKGGVLCNLACGSASIMIEHLGRGVSNVAIGIDNDSAMLSCASTNLGGAGDDISNRAHLVAANAIRSPFSDGTIEALCADLPFGQRVGSHELNRQLYPALLKESARIARPGASFVLLSHEVKLIRAILQGIDVWHLEREIPITLRGLHPHIYVLRRVNASFV